MLPLYEHGTSEKLGILWQAKHTSNVTKLKAQPGGVSHIVKCLKSLLENAAQMNAETGCRFLTQG